MLKRKIEPIDRDQERAARLRPDDYRGATPERLRREPFEVGDDRQGTKIVRIISPLERMRRDGRLSGAEYDALQRYKHHWHHSGQQPALSSVDPNRIFASDVLSFSGMAKSEAQAHHRQQYRAARLHLGHRPGIVADNVVCYENTLEIAGYGIGYASPYRARAAAFEILQDCAHRLAKFWGIG